MSYYAALQRLSLDGEQPAEPSGPPTQNGSAQSSPADHRAAPNAVSSRSYADAAGAAATATADVAAMDGPAILTPFPLDDKAPAAETPPRPQLLQDALIWVDLEMTGLDLRTDSVIEIAVIVTDAQLRKEIAGPEVAIHHPDAVLDAMNEWSQEHHGASGLTDRCRASTISMQEAEERVLAFVQRYTDGSTRHHLAGSSVHVDLAFLRKDMPRLAAHLPYRVVDVSTVMELCRRWYPAEYAKAPRKRNAHTALSDIQDSLRQLRHYRRAIFKSQPLPHKK